MGGSRHRGIGFNRAKKKKPPAAEAVVEESMDVDMAKGEAVAGPGLPLEPAPAPAVPPLDSFLPADEFQGRSSAREGLEEQVKFLLLLARIKVGKSRHELRKVKRKWQRCQRSYVDTDKYSVWDEPSTVARVQERLMKADVELGEARARYVMYEARWARLRSLCMWYKRLLVTGGEDPVVRRFFDRARARCSEGVSRPIWKSQWEGMGQNFGEWSTSRKH